MIKDVTSLPLPLADRLRAAQRRTSQLERELEEARQEYFQLNERLHQLKRDHGAALKERNALYAEFKRQKKG